MKLWIALGLAIALSTSAWPSLAASTASKEFAAAVARKPDEVRGAALFEKCAACHGPQLQGLIGPNLTDEYWIHGKGTLSDIAGVIRTGAVEKGMPSWDGQLQNEEIRALAVFVASQIGSNPANPKPPQGEKIGALGRN